MATIPVTRLTPGDQYASSAGVTGGQVANLGTNQTGNGNSTNIVDRLDDRGVGVVRIVSTVGATPTVTVAIEGSMEASTWYPVAYADLTTPETPSVATFTITTATTTRKILRPNHPWRYLRLVYSANTNVTLTADYLV